MGFGYILKCPKFLFLPCFFFYMNQGCKICACVFSFFFKENQENKAVVNTPEMFLLLHLFKAIFDYFIGVDYYTQNLKTNSDFTV